jgi:hypothetical protein
VSWKTTTESLRNGRAVLDVRLYPTFVCAKWKRTSATIGLIPKTGLCEVSVVHDERIGDLPLTDMLRSSACWRAEGV